MSASVMWKLIAKDLFLLRWMIVGALVSGAVSLAIMPLSAIAGYVGTVSVICVLIVLNIVLAMDVAQERKEKVLLFVLSLPVSTTQYLIAKLAANVIAFGVPWLVLTAGAIVLIDVTHLPNGILPFWIAMLAYLLFYYCVLLAVVLWRESTGWYAAAITAGNVSVNFVIVAFLSLPSVAQHKDAAAAVWTGDILAIVAIEIVAGVAALALAVRSRVRRPDFL